MRLYLDTSAIVSYFDKSSVFHLNAVKLFQFPDLTLYSGIISVMELESVISRNIGQFTLDSGQSSEKLLTSLSDSEKIPIIAQYCFKRMKIILITPITPEKFEFNGSQYDIINTNHLALKLNREMKLRTLDAIQIASAVEIRIYYKIIIDYFVTNDFTILDKKQELYQKARILPISTEDLVHLLDIS